MRAAVLLALVLAAAPACRAQISATPPPVRAERGMVVAAEHLAAEAGLGVLRAGGNAADAAAATGFALAVTFPVAGNLGGGGFAVLRQPDGSATTLDFRETAPAAATRDMYLGPDGEPDPDLSRRGWLAVGVPGAVAGLLEMQRRWGRLDRAAVLDPAVALARDGFPLSDAEAARLNGFRTRFADFAATDALFGGTAAARAGNPDSLWRAGDRLRQPDLARTLTRIRDRGRDGFYRGPTADFLVDAMRAGGGLITHADLASYRPVERAPVEGTYRGHRVLSMPPPSSGGVALVQLLNAVEPHDLGALGFGSSASVHLMAEAMRRVYADRAEWLGDPDFVDVPVAGLTGKGYMTRRMADFDAARAGASDSTAAGAPPESPQTTHFSIVDRDGFAVSLTTTLNGAYGSLAVAPGTGFLLNNEMDDFSAKPGTPNMFGLVGAEANAIAPGKRMLSSMSPTIVEWPDGRLRLVVGSPGGGRIITTVFETITNVIDHGMDVQAAVAAPRVHHQWLPDVLFVEERGLAADAVAALRERGWTVRQGGRWSRADAIEVVYRESDTATDPSGLETTETRRAGRVLLGGADPRGEDVAVGW